MIKEVKKNRVIEPMALRQKDAAFYCGVSIPTFLSLVEKGVLPSPRHLTQTLQVWVRSELESALWDLPNNEAFTEPTGFEALHR